MELRRVKGRPPRGFGDVGRDKLIEAARTLLQKKTQVDINRKEIADAAGVTPALVSYYFPDRRKLIEAAAEPVIAEASQRLTAILQGPDTHVAKIRAIIRAFVVFSSVNSALLEHYLHRLKGRDRVGSYDAALSAYTGSVTFLQTLMNTGILRRGDPHFTLLALWGMCRVIAQDLDCLMGYHADTGMEQDSIDLRTDAIFQLFLDGAGIRPTLQFRHAPAELGEPPLKEGWTSSLETQCRDRGLSGELAHHERGEACNGAAI